MYTPLPVPKYSWEDLGTDFVLGLLHMQKGMDPIFIVVDGFFKMSHFIPYRKIFDALHVATVFFQEIVRLYGVPSFIVSDQDSKFLTIFWTIL